MPAALLERAQHYHTLRNRIVHERAVVEVSESDIRKYRTVIQQVLQILFGIDVSQR